MGVVSDSIVGDESRAFVLFKLKQRDTIYCSMHQRNAIAWSWIHGMSLRAFQQATESLKFSNLYHGATNCCLSIAIVSPLVFLMEKQVCNLLNQEVKCLPLSATTHGKDCTFPMKAAPKHNWQKCSQSCCCICTCPSVLLSAMATACLLYTTSHFPLCGKWKVWTNRYVYMLDRPSFSATPSPRRLF